MAETARWYVVHTYSGYENTVKATIEKTVESRNLHNQILAVSIPLETVTEITDNGPKEVERKVQNHGDDGSPDGWDFPKYGQFDAGIY